jgi:CzcA family heavy metal efflux pump
MNWLIETSLRFRYLVVALAIGMIVVGVQTASDLPLDVFPEFAPPRVEIQTEAPGLSTEEVDSLVTVPIENALGGIPYLDEVRSKSVLGLSSIQLYFERGTDLLVARQLVQERLTVSAARLPRVVNQPVILPPLSSLSRAMKIGLWSETQSQMDMTVLCKWTIRPRLMDVAGVANVAIWGDYDKQFQVLVDPDRLRANNISLNSVIQSVTQSVNPISGGFVDTPNQRMAVRHQLTVNSADELGKTIVAFRSNASIALDQVADVVVGSPPPIGDAIINDVPGILLIVEKQPWANTLEVTRNVEAAMRELAPALTDVHVDTTIFRPATFIERALANLSQSLLVGCVLVIVVLAFFLYDWRAAIISSAAIPLSLVSAVLVLYFRGETINTMVLAGLIIALGEVVDDAIIDVENIQRRLRLNRELAQPQTDFQVVLAASLEVRSAVIYATLIVVLTLVPVFLLDGLAGSFFRPLAASYILAISASLIVALTITPAMSLLLLTSSSQRQHRESPIASFAKRVYRRTLPFFLRRSSTMIAMLVIVFAGAAWSIPQLGEELMPKFKETDFLMHWVEKPGIGIDAMNRITIAASKELRAIEGVNNFGSHIGRAEAADEVYGPHFTELWISIDPNVNYGETVAKVQEAVDGYPGLYRDLLTYLSERIKEVLTGASGAIVVRVYGPDLAQLQSHAREVSQVIKSVAGVTNLKVEPQTLIPQIVVKLRSDAAAQFGLTPGEVRAAVTTLVRGTQVGEVYESQKIFRVMVWGKESVRSDFDAIQRLMIDTPSGGQVPLSDVADVAIQPAPNEIKRVRGFRKIDVTCNVDGRDLGSVARDIEKQVLSQVTFQQEYHPEFLGEYAEARASRNRLLGATLVTLVGIVLLLYSDFQSTKAVLLILMSLPFALVGGLAGTLLSGGVLSLGSLVGFVTVLGVAVRNGIMLLDHYRHLQKEEGMEFGQALILRGAEERLAPILMTALTTGLALVPLILTGDKPGQEIEYPMAFVVLGGLTTSTLLNLLVLPALCLRFGRNAFSVADA